MNRWLKERVAEPYADLVAWSERHTKTELGEKLGRLVLILAGRIDGSADGCLAAFGPYLHHFAAKAVARREMRGVELSLEKAADVMTELFPHLVSVQSAT